MTDTTDIKALREFLMEQIDHVDSYGGKVWLCAEDARLAMSSLDQLEAERQRADTLQRLVHVEASSFANERVRADKLAAHIAALKGEQVPMAIDADIIRDANRYRFLRDEDAWGEDSDSWDVETRTGLISSENLMGGLSPDHFDAAIDARMAASDIPFLNPVTAPQKPIAITDDMAIAFHAATTDSPLGRDDMEEIKTGLQAVHELFTAPQKPVVLPPLASIHSNWSGEYLDKADVIAAIEAAGGIVKDGE